jgi:hypothetical protein
LVATAAEALICLSGKILYGAPFVGCDVVTTLPPLEAAVGDP